ncbi:hypothetical protein ACPXCO_07795 [Streptomyces cyaneofuscatus]|uniref:hypothetical protein n=2 Tax=Streptomyces TaxID=1883 RepID=UPI000978F54F|nr:MULTISPECIES: hypothetical protein [unclassified Streptomyces]ONI50997.1 hypothetical protein STIB_47990 [Streptomyces sp. IB2014 011-1]RDV49013.1 hypothetical protein DDV98_25930 [Streptomyces sp. IB2014 011-12]CAD5973560.1 conserved protein of unknown function [Streptomyces sp. KY75]
MNAPAKPDGPLSKAEFNQFRDLLRRYCAHELDQWENLQTETPYGPVYVLLTRSLPPGTSAEAYRPFWPTAGSPTTSAA